MITLTQLLREENRVLVEPVNVNRPQTFRFVLTDDCDVLVSLVNIEEEEEECVIPGNMIDDIVDLGDGLYRSESLGRQLAGFYEFLVYKSGL